MQIASSQKKKMDGSHFGEPNFGSGRSGSSRKGKKSNSDKPKQPQRGLGVAQLEKIRLHNQMGCSYLPSIDTPNHTNLNQEENMRVESTYSAVQSSSSPSFGFHPNIMMGVGEKETTDFRYGSSQSSATTRNHSEGILETQHSVQPNTSKHLFSLHVEDMVQKKRRKDRCESMGSTSQNSDSSDTQEIDLDLKLSL